MKDKLSEYMVNFHYFNGTRGEEENIEWEIQENVLTINGTGYMPDYTTYTK